MIVVVLDDGETYSEAAGCKIVEVPDNIDPEDIEFRLKQIRDGEDVGLLKVLARFG